MTNVQIQIKIEKLERRLAKERVQAMLHRERLGLEDKPDPGWISQTEKELMQLYEELDRSK